MKASVAVVVAQVAIWILHSRRTPRPYTWKCYVVVLGTAAAGLLELFDFPPVFNRIFDAHSLWHASTVPLGFLWYVHAVNRATRPRVVASHVCRTPPPEPCPRCHCSVPKPRWQYFKDDMVWDARVGKHKLDGAEAGEPEVSE